MLLSATGVTRIPKHNFKKPNEREEIDTVNGIEVRKSKLGDYDTLTGIVQHDKQVKVMTFRSYLSRHMYNILQFSFWIRDDDERSRDDVLDAIRFVQGVMYY